MIDAHVHLVDFRQRTDGLDSLIRAMDAAQIDFAVVCGLQVKKEWSEWERTEPKYYLSDNCRCYYYSLTDAIVAENFRKLPASHRRRILPLLCGFNPVDKHASDCVQSILDMFPGVFRGIGEILCRHDDLTNQLLGQPPRANHPALDKVYRLAAEKQLPVLLHQDITSIGGSDEPVYLHELEEPLAEHPETTFVWAHCGASRRVILENHLEHVERLIQSYANLYVDYSWLVFDEVICDDAVPKPEWIEFTERHSERVCIGSDVVGEFDELEKSMGRYESLLSELSPGARKNIGHETALGIYGSPS